MKKSRRKFNGAFKAQVAIEALRERETLHELSKRYELHPTIISKWKNEFLEKSAGVFDKKSEAEASLNVLKQAIKEHGKPEIINSDQGSPFTCEDWVKHLNEEGIKISMDGKGRAIDNIFIERFWRTLKYDYVYLHPANDGLELYQGVKEYIRYYNHDLHHQGIGRKIPAELYQPAA